tara:strand:+ start:3077 stop:3748 length:672 start_codon:yes stop_codon:yes gene_type:complete
MNNKNQISNMFIKSTSAFIKDNLKKIIILFIIIFLLFLIYQGYTFYNINKINKLSISYFSNNKLDDEFTKYSEMQKLSNERGFYSILSTLELIKNHINNEDYDKSLELYNDILNTNDLDKNYVSLLAINGAYNFIDIVIKNKNDKYISNINKFISLIDENLENYIGNKNELLYLVSILSLKDDSQYKTNTDLLIFYDNLINNEKISSSIKERVKKIHEFYIFI